MPDKDELPVARLRAAGALILGKTNVPELTLEGYTRNDLFGVTRNPWDIRLTPGGSSGGAASGVAAGLVPAAIGTDGGGSIRRPACHTGLVGWKPSTGRFPRIDGLPAILNDFETIGTLTRTLDDALLLDAAMAGPDARDRRSLYAQSPQQTRPKWRIVYIPRFADSPVDPEVDAATAAIAEALGRDGHDVTEGKVFFDLEDAGRIWHVISRASVAWLMGWSKGRLDAAAGDNARAMAADGVKLTAADYVDALERIAAFRRRCAETFATTDLVLTPTAAALPWPPKRPTPIVSRTARQAPATTPCSPGGQTSPAFRRSISRSQSQRAGCRSGFSSWPGSAPIPRCSHSPTRSRSNSRPRQYASGTAISNDQLFASPSPPLIPAQAGNQRERVDMPIWLAASPLSRARAG
jgi:aspartyl-tRNA(Asn)/glutamyl-tRNA(Gln) amidotransferase subunit A